MEHRYGRHGPRAWLRWYKQHYAQPQHTLVPVLRPQVIVIIQQEERIVFIVAENVTFQYGDDDTTPFSRAPLELPSGDRDLENTAKNYASDDYAEIQGWIEDAPIRIRWEKAERRIQTIARQIIPPQGMALEERERRISVIQACYKQALTAKVKGNPRILSIDNSQRAQLQELAQRDRETYPTYMSIPLHKRDLSLLRVLTVLGLYAGEDDTALFETIHDLADWYDGCFRVQSTEVRDWPEPFRGER